MTLLLLLKTPWSPGPSLPANLGGTKKRKRWRKRLFRTFEETPLTYHPDLDSYLDEVEELASKKLVDSLLLTIEGNWQKALIIKRKRLTMLLALKEFFFD